MATKKPAKKVSDWPLRPNKVIPRYVPKDDTLVSDLAALQGLNQELAEQIAKDGDWPTEAGELATKYGLSQMDAENILKVLNVSRGVESA